MKYLSFLLTFVFVLTSNSLTAQDKSKALVSFHSNKVLIGINNPFRVVIQQAEPVSIDQLQAVLLNYGEEAKLPPVSLDIAEYDDTQFMLRPSEAGVVIVTVTLKNGTKEQYNFPTQPLTAASKIGPWGAKTKVPVPTNVFTSQRGLYTQVEGLDINAQCKVLSYDLIRVTGAEDARIAHNEGGSYGLEAKRLINLAEPGDRYVFTKIRYRCPGVLEDQVGETLSFELK